MPMANEDKIRVLVITLGGEREAILRRMFGEFSVEVEFIQGVPSRSIRCQAGLMRAAYSCGLLLEDPEETVLIGKKTSQSGTWDDMDYAEELWKKGRSLSRERAVLACLFAHLRAMRKAVEEDFDIILEDNVRMLRDAAILIREFKRESSGASARFFGYLGPEDNLRWLYNVHVPKYSSTSAKSPFPFFEHYDDSMSGTSLWGAYGYMVDRRGYEAIMKKLQTDIGALMWRGKVSDHRMFSCICFHA